MFQSSDSEEDLVTAESEHSIERNSFSSIVLDFHLSRYFSFLIENTRLPNKAFVNNSLQLLSECAQSNIQRLLCQKDSPWYEEVQKRIPIWKLIHTVFCHKPNRQSYGAYAFLHHTLNQLWDMIVERGDLLLLAEMITFCRVYSRVNREDVFQYIVNCKRFDIDNVLMMAAAMLDRKQLFDRKMEFLKYVLISSKLQMPRIPIS